MDSGKRQLGKIGYVKSGEEDHGVITCSVGIDFSGSHQGFGNLCLDSQLVVSFEKELCDVFAVDNTEKLIGQECYALRCFGHWNDTIEGLESVKTGKRFTLTSWKRKYITDTWITNPLSNRINSLNARIVQAQRRIEEDKLELARCELAYTNWDKDEI